MLSSLRSSFFTVRPLAGILLSLCVMSAANAQQFYYNNFEQFSGSQLYDEETWEQDWLEPAWEDGIREGRVSVIRGSEAYRGGASLAVTFPKGGVGTKDGGAQWKLELPGPYTMVRLRYLVKFGSGFDFVRGGKLPGLAGGTAPTGNRTADGYNGFSTRLMWRTPFEGTPGDPRQCTANMLTYSKHPGSGFDGEGRDEDDDYWTDKKGELIEIQSGRWYRVTQLVKMNSDGRSNGRMKCWLNGKLALDKRGIEFRKTRDFGVDVFYFSTFFGGGSEEWAPSKDEVIYFDEFDITIRKK
ncbi:MAG: polysaccharide lyase [Pirellulaceae bacterium]